MSRRIVLAALAASALPSAGLLAAAAPARAQEPGRVARIGVLVPGPPPAPPGGAVDRFRRQLAELGWVEGRNVALELRFDGYDPALAGQQVGELLRAGVDVIVAGTTLSTRIARQATSTVPIVMAVSADPVADGLVASLARPGGNVTGLSVMNPELTAKRLQLLQETVPGLARVALLLDTGFPRWRAELAEHEAAARALGLALLPVQAGAPPELAAAFDAAVRQRAQALVLMFSPMLVDHAATLAALALERRLPAISGAGESPFAREGGLMNYGPSLGGSWQRAAFYVHRLLNGARPAELPVEQPTRFELVINRRTAERLGLAVPAHLLLVADEVVR